MPIEEAVLLQGTRALGRHSFAQLFANGAPEEIDPETRRALLQVLAEVGKAEDAAVVVDLVADAEPSNAKVVAAFEAAVAGIVSREIKLLIIAVVVGVVYGGLVWGVLPIVWFISWESHLFGLLTGAMAGYWWGRSVTRSEV